MSSTLDEHGTQEKVLIWVIWMEFFPHCLSFLGPFQVTQVYPVVRKKTSNRFHSTVSHPIILETFQRALCSDSSQMPGDFVEISHTFDSFSTP